MPQRSERFFWIRGEQLGTHNVIKFDQCYESLLSKRRGIVQFDRCTNRNSDPQLWLFRLQSLKQRDCNSFSSELQEYTAQIPKQLGIREARLKRISTLPTPMLCPRIGKGFLTDLGLHVVNDEYNGMMLVYTYHEGPAGRYFIPHYQPGEMRIRLEEVETKWREIACHCHNGLCDSCRGIGCYDCFKRDCAICGGTGWTNFARWSRGGFRIDYSSGFPLADF